MSFSLPTDLATNFVDNSSTVDAAYFNGVSTMGNALKAAIATWGFNPVQAYVAATESTTSTSYTDLTTTTDSVYVPIGSSGKALVLIRSYINGGAVDYGGWIGYAMSGANTASASDSKAMHYWKNGTFTTAFFEEGLTPGFTTFKLKYRSNAGTSSSFAYRSITVIPFPSTDGTHASATLPVDLTSSFSLGMGGAGVNRPVFDAAATQKSDSATSLTWTHTATAGATVLVALTRGPAGSGGSATYDGNAMSLVGSIAANNTPGSYATTYLFAASNVAGGAKTVVASWTTAATGAACSVSYTGVAGLGQVTVGYGSSATPTQTVAATNNDGRLLVCAQSINGGGSGTITGVSGGTQRALAQPANHYYDTVVQDATGNSVSFGVTPSATPAIWGGVSVELMPSVPTYSNPTWVGTGVGANRQPNPGYSWVDTVPADANLALVWVSEMPSDQANNCTITLGGTNMVEVTGSPWVYDFTSNYNRIRCFALLNPPTGPNKTVAITDNVSNYFHAHSVYYGGVGSVGTAVFSRGAPSSSTTTTIASTASNHLYAQAFSYRPNGDNTWTAFSGRQRAVHSNLGGGYTQPLVVGDVYGNDSALTITATRDNTTYAWGGVTIDLSPAALPTPSTPTFVGTGAGRPHIAGNYSWTETVPANANLAVLWVSVMGPTAVSATLGGTAMVPITGSPFLYYSGNYSVQVFYLLNPPTGGGKTLALTNSNGNNHHAVVTYYGGVNGVFNPVTTSTGAAGQQPQLSVANSQSNHLYVNAMAFRPSTTWDSITGYDQTKRVEHPCFSYDLPMLVGDGVGNGSTLTFNGTRNNTTYEWGGVIVDLSPDTRPSAAFNLALTPTIGMTGAGVKPTIQGSNTNNSATVTIPTHASGDLIIVYAHRSTNAVPSKPSASGTVPAWVDIESTAGSYSSFRTAQFIATGDNHTSGTWTNADAMAAIVIRNANSSTPIGGFGHSAESATGNTCPGASITLTKTNGSSLILEFYGYGDGVNAVTAVSTAPTGHTRVIAGVYSANKVAVCVNSKDDTTSDGATAQPSTTGCYTRGASVEVLSQAQ